MSHKYEKSVTSVSSIPVTPVFRSFKGSNLSVLLQRCAYSSSLSQSVVRVLLLVRPPSAIMAEVQVADDWVRHLDVKLGERIMMHHPLP